MNSEETNLRFKQFLDNFTRNFQDELNQENLDALKNELNSSFSRDEIIECWTDIFKVQGPLEQVSDNKYEIYDVSNFMGESSGSSSDYIHTVEFSEGESNSGIFMKFYLVFYCLVNGMKSSQYQIIRAGSGAVQE
jgi:hypothetical protein